MFFFVPYFPANWFKTQFRKFFLKTKKRKKREFNLSYTDIPYATSFVMNSIDCFA